MVLDSNKARLLAERRCKRCRKIPRGKLNKANFERYYPFCSYHCQEWDKLDNAFNYIAKLKEEQEICKVCGKTKSDSKHMKYGNDLDNSVKHMFESKQ